MLVVSGLWFVNFACSRLWFSCMFVSVGSSLSGLFYGGVVWIGVDFWCELLGYIVAAASCCVDFL